MGRDCRRRNAVLRFVDERLDERGVVGRGNERVRAAHALGLALVRAEAGRRVGAPEEHLARVLTRVRRCFRAAALAPASGSADEGDADEPEDDQHPRIERPGTTEVAGARA